MVWVREAVVAFSTSVNEPLLLDSDDPVGLVERDEREDEDAEEVLVGKLGRVKRFDWGLTTEVMVSGVPGSRGNSTWALKCL